MGYRNQPPQTVGEALSAEWDWIALKCIMCRRQGKITLAEHPRDTKLAALIRRSFCQRCKSRQANAALVARSRMLYTKDIAVEGDTIVKASMH